MKAIVLSFDCLPITTLGCFGCEHIRTPQFDRLAARSVSHDGCFAVAPDATCADWFSAADPQLDGHRTLEKLRQAGAKTSLLREPGAGDAAAIRGFDRSVVVEGDDGLNVEDFETPFGQLVAEAERVIAGWTAREPELLWLMSRGVPIPWVSPQDFTAPYAEALQEELDAEDEDEADDDRDLEALSSADVATRGLDGDERVPECAEPAHDTESAAQREPQAAGPPDEAVEDSDGELDDYERFVFSGGRLRAGECADREMDAEDWELARVAFAGYVALLDHWLERLLDALSCIEDDWLLIVFANHGRRLRAAGELTANSSQLADEVLRVPLLLTAKDSDTCKRRRELLQVPVVLPTLLDWFETKPEAEAESLLPVLRSDAIAERDYLCFEDASHQAVRTADYLYVAPRPACESVSELADAGGAAAEAGRLFEKPDDFWEILDVAQQNPAVTRQLAETLAAFRAWQAGSQTGSVPPPLSPLRE